MPRLFGTTPSGGRAALFAIGAISAAAAFVVGTAWRRGLRVVRTDSGLALVETVQDETGRPVRVLRFGGVYQSATYLDEGRFEPVFSYYRAFDRVFSAGRPVHDVLALGGGGCSWPKHAITSREDVRIDVVEVDSGIAAAARRWFFVDEAALRARRGSSLALHVADGRAWLEREDGALYDAVVNDAFSGSEPAMSLASVEAALAVKRRLRAGGVYAANVVSRGEGSDVGFLRDVTATLREAFAFVAIVECADEDFGEEDNYLVFASDAPLPFEDAIAFGEEFLGNVIRDV